MFAAGFLFGALRVALSPLTGELIAVALELPIVLIISWLVCRRLIIRFAIPAVASQRLAVGALAFCLLMLAELGLSVPVFNGSGDEYSAFLQTAPGLLGLAGQIAIALFPIVHLKQIAQLKNNLMYF